MTGGNMYRWIGYTWNPLAGQCLHDCEYCYVKSLAKRYPTLRKKYSGEIRLDTKALNKKLPRNKTIFVCSMNDLFADGVTSEYIKVILEKVNEQWLGRRFLFQTKNPKRLFEFGGMFPEDSIFAITLESNRNLIKTYAPSPEERARYFAEFKEAMLEDSVLPAFEITIEPLLKFDLDQFINMIKRIKPDFVSIGADSKYNHLPEPSEEKIVALVQRLKEEGISIHLKKNLKRLAPSLFSEGNSRADLANREEEMII